MIKQRITVFATFVFLGASMLFPSPSFAKSETIRVQVLGMVCDFCAQSLELIFMEQGDVEQVKVNLSETRVDIITKNDKTLSNNIIKDLIERAGYDVDSISRE